MLIPVKSIKTRHYGAGPGNFYGRTIRSGDWGSTGFFFESPEWIYDHMPFIPGACDGAGPGFM